MSPASKVRSHLILISWIALTLSVLTQAKSASPEDAASNPPILAAPGVLDSQGDLCTATIEVSPEGGFLNLKVENKSTNKSLFTVRDVTAVAWLNTNVLIVSVSPLYGKPGLYAINCLIDKLDRLVTPVSIDSGYPDGADYFELHKIAGNRIEYYYAPDVDTADFVHLRNAKHLRVYNWPH